MNKAFEEIIEELEVERTTANNTFAKYEMKVDLGRVFGLEKAIEIIKQEAEKYNNGWIPCSERLPEYDEEYIKKYNNDKQYIVICKYSYEPTVAHFSKEKIWYYDDFVKFNDVIAWQPLPEPYKES